MRDKQDRSIRGYKTCMKMEPEETRALVDLIIKNTYRILMTRGMKGCYIYCSVEQTTHYFRCRASSVELNPSTITTKPIATLAYENALGI
ncbi:DNA/RNA helicase domain-containing protein [Pseudomonas sp. S1(2024)]|uniref:DNA/RNA helicase domain-containing protein n=1 Tax=Pseudomonas sp. S1(2024) TaxID=3390191 RepID=UPI003978BDF1